MTERVCSSCGMQGRVALVTGGSRNLGLGVAREFSSAGARVAIVGRDQARLEEAKRQLASAGHEVHIVQSELAEAASAEQIVSDVESTLGPVEILVNNAAVRPHVALEDIGSDDWDEVHAVNLRAPFLLAQRTLPTMQERKWGRIINISGLDAFWGESGRAHVVASKLGIVGLTRALASEAAREGVTVNCIVPGVMDTDRHTLAWWPEVEQFYDRVRSLIPMGRLGDIDELSRVAHFLASDMASYLTGQTLFVTGGAFPMTNGLAKS